MIKHFRVYGRVQGVSFRARTRDLAQQLALHGWVRNCPDGSVELVAAGAAEQLLSLEQWLYDGPPLAKVDKLDVVELADSLAIEPLPVGFIVRH